MRRLFSVAPMMEWTDRDCRFFHRLLSRRALLYTEMITAPAILRGKRNRLLEFSPEEHPLALQLGGSDPKELAECARIAEGYGYDEINLNVGCPSDRVQSGRFGACLMAEPDLVAACVAAMAKAVRIPVTVKSRIGIDDRDSYEELHHFIGTVARAGCRTFIVHARKAWLKGLSPRENREKPPLRYEVVRRLALDFPDLEFILNGGIRSLQEARVHLQDFPGVMVGRAAYETPYLLAGVDALYGDTRAAPSREEVVLAMVPYLERRLAEGIRFNQVVRHLHGLFHGEKGARAWRRYLSEEAPREDSAEALRRSLRHLPLSLDSRAAEADIETSAATSWAPFPPADAS